MEKQYFIDVGGYESLSSSVHIITPLYTFGLFQVQLVYLFPYNVYFVLIIYKFKNSLFGSRESRCCLIKACLNVQNNLCVAYWYNRQVRKLCIDRSDTFLNECVHSLKKKPQGNVSLPFSSGSSGSMNVA